MSDLPVNPSGGAALPPATPFDPGAGPLPPALEWSGAGRPEPTVLLVDASDDPAWAADAAVAVAAAWAQAGRRVVLADLHLQDPVLHDRLGEPNLDGVVDVFLYGASLSRAARPVPGRGFYLISSGTYPGDADAVLRHPRWPRIAAGFADARATLLLFVPADSAAGLASLSGWAPTAVVLGEPDPAVLPPGLRVLAVAVPPAGAEEFAREELSGLDGTEAGAEPEMAEAEGPEVILWTDPYEERADPLIGEYAGGIPASTLPAGAVKVREADLRDPPPALAAEREVVVKPKGRSWLRPLLLLLLGAVVIYAAAYYADRANPELFGRILGDRGPARPEAGTPAAVPAPPVAAAPAAAGVPLPYSVQAKAFASLRAARQMVEGDSARLSGIPLYVSPELVDRVLYYKVMAGVLADTVQAAQLREQLVYAKLVEESDAQAGTWSLLQFTPLAFDLGEFGTRAEAQARVDSLLGAEVPAYPVPLPAAPGAERWRVYGGAFRDSVGAEGMRRILGDRKIEARLVERVGLPAAPRE